MFLANQIHIGHVLPLLLFSAGIALFVADTRTRGRDEKQAQMQHAAYELGRRVALAETRAAAA